MYGRSLAARLTMPEGSFGSPEMARRAVYFFAPGALLVALAALLPNPEARSLPLLLAAGTAAVVVVFVSRFGARQSLQFFVGLLGLGTMLVSIATRFGGEAAPGLAFIYVWAALYGFYCLPLRVAIAELLFIGGNAVVALPHTSWLVIVLIVLTSAVAGLWTREASVRVQGLARVDALTGSPNRRAWDEGVRAATQRAEHGGGVLFVALLDLDHFKVFNDEQGHPAGDLVLQAVAADWQSQVAQPDLLARSGGEEFGVIHWADTLSDAIDLVERLRTRVPHGLTCSAGIAGWEAGENATLLFSRAAAALYEAKRRGRDRLVVAPAPSVAAGDDPMSYTAQWSSTVHDVLDCGTVPVAFQPIRRLLGDQVIAYEALARPRGLDAGVGVDGFFAASQRLGRLREVDHLCRRAALEQAAGLPGGAVLFVNISVAALVDPYHDVDQTLLLLRMVGRAPSQLVLEVSEKETITHLPRMRELMAAYREHGIRFALDDVGEGHSTVETLAAAEPEFVKLSMRLVRERHHAGTGAAIQAVLRFAEVLGSVVIAEGVEAEEVSESLRDLGIGLGQGYHLGRPAAADDAGVAEAASRSA